MYLFLTCAPYTSIFSSLSVRSHIYIYILSLNASIIALNILRNLCNAITKACVELRAFLDASKKTEVAQRVTYTVVMDALQCTARACREPLPELPSSHFTHLDQFVRDLRESEKISAAEIAEDLLRLLEVSLLPVGCALPEF